MERDKVQMEIDKVDVRFDIIPEVRVRSDRRVTTELTSTIIA